MKTIKTGESFENNVTYTADREQYDVYLRDTTRVEDKTYLSVSDIDHFDVAFFLCGLKNVTLDFRGAVLTLHGRIQPFLIDECENITIKNVTVEYERSFYTEFDILGSENGKLRLKAKEKFPCRVEDGYLIPYADTWESRDLNKGPMFLQAFDSESGKGLGLTVVTVGEKTVLDEKFPFKVRELKVREEKGEIVFYGEVPENWHTGMTAVLAHEKRDKSSVLVCRTKGLTLDNYRILNGAGMGIYGMYSENITLRGVMLCRDGRSHGIIANAADAMHLVSCRGKIVIEDSVFEGMVDDALNVHTNYYIASGAKGNVLSAHAFKGFFLTAHFKLFGEGDIIAVYKGHTTEHRAEYTVKDVRIIDNSRIELVTDCPAVDISEGDIIENLSTQPELTIKNCRFDKANSHLRIQTRGETLIEDCETSLPFWLTGDYTIWYEASPVNDLTVRRCKFIGERAYVRAFSECNPTPASPYYHRNIRVLDNVFDRHAALIAEAADEIVFRGNRLSDGGMPKIELKSCGKAEISDCEVVRKDI